MSWAAEVAQFAGLEPDTLRKLNTLHPMDAPAGTVLFQPGDAVRGYVVVLGGRVDVHLIGPTGRDIFLYEVTAGKCCIQSTLGLLGGEDYTAEAVAATPARLIVLPREMFLDLIETAPRFRALVFRAFAERMQAMMQLLERVAFERVEARLARVLLERTQDGATLKITQAELATAIGSAREVVSRNLDTMARRGWLELDRGRITVRDRTALDVASTQSRL